MRRLLGVLLSYANRTLVITHAKRFATAAQPHGGKSASGGGRTTDITHGTIPGPDGKPLDATNVIVNPADDEVGLGTGASAGGSFGTAGATVDKSSQLFVKQCPDGDGKVPGDFAGRDNQMTSLDVHGKHLIQQQLFSWEGKLEGHVAGDGKIKDFEYHATAALEVRGRVVNGAGKLLAHIPTRVLRLRADRTEIDPHNPVGVFNDSKHFSFNGRGPKGLITAYVDPLLSLAVVIDDKVITGTRSGAPSRYLEGERHWYDDAACLKAEFTPPSGRHVSSGENVGIDTVVKTTPGEAEVPMHLTASAGGGASVSPDAADAGPGAPARFSWTAPAKGTNLYLRVEGVSKRGRIQGAWDATIEPACCTYKILGATTTTSATGSSAFDLCSLGGITTKVTRTLSSTLAGQPSPPISELEETTLNGVRYVSGTIDARITSTYVDSVDGCEMTTDGNFIPCSFTSPVQTIPADAQYDVDFQPWTSTTTQFGGSWWVPSAEIGVASGSYDTPCFFPYLLFFVPPAETAQSNPVSSFTASGSHSIAFSGSKHFANVNTGTMDYTWATSITYQRIDGGG